jgi:hypothetical protein
MSFHTLSKYLLCLSLACFASSRAHAADAAPAGDKVLKLSAADYEDRVNAIWTGQIIGVLMGFQFEHKVASTEWVDKYPKRYQAAPVDDDWYYEMCAVRAFEKYGIEMTVDQLGKQWLENSCGSWGSSEQARLQIAKGIPAAEAGHPRYNKFWFAIGSQFSADVYGALAPGMPNLAATMARKYGHINGYAEAVDGAAFVAGMVSLGFVESDPRKVVREAAQLIDPRSPYRKCLDLVIRMAEAGNSPQQIADELEDRWHLEYPATINAIPNAGHVVIGLWFGEGDFLKTVNYIYRLADYTDADCNAANAAAVLGAMHGTQGLPPALVKPLNDRITGAKLGPVTLTPAVDETISGLARRTAAIGSQILAAHGATVTNGSLAIPVQTPETQPSELFTLSDLTKYWNPAWKLERAGIGGAGGMAGNLRGLTHLEGDVLATWPRDTVRGVVLRHTLTPTNGMTLSFQVAADPTRAWQLLVYAGNKLKLKKLIDGGTDKDGERKWEEVKIDLSPLAGKEVQLRLYQNVLLADKLPGNAYWRNLRFTEDKPASAP